MLRIDGKKINAAFRRLRERRAAVGENTTAEETPDQEAARIKREMEMASMRGDISALLNLVVSTSSMTAADFIKKSCGGLLFMYYTVVEQLHTRPVELIDMVDSLLYLDAKRYIEKQHADKLKQQYANKTR